MKTRGRNICDTLKAIRKQIADANGIDYSPEECNYKGECMGTCPKCEQDVRDLEYELHLRQMAGKAIKVAGIAAGLVAMTACSDGKVQRISPDATKSELNLVKKKSLNLEADNWKEIYRLVMRLNIQKKKIENKERFQAILE